MIRAVRLLVAMVVFIVIFVFVVAPALQQTFVAMEPFLGGAIGGVLAPTRTALFLAMPLLFLGGAVLLFFLIAAGLRGTSFQ